MDHQLPTNLMLCGHFIKLINTAQSTVSQHHSTYQELQKIIHRK
jgi:hypothetical protein